MAGGGQIEGGGVMLTWDAIKRCLRLDATYQDSPKYPSIIGYLEVNNKTGEVSTYDINGKKDIPIEVK